MTDKNTLFSCILHEWSLLLHGNVSPQPRGDRVRCRHKINENTGLHTLGNTMSGRWVKQRGHSRQGSAQLGLCHPIALSMAIRAEKHWVYAVLQVLTYFSELVTDCSFTVLNNL